MEVTIAYENDIAMTIQLQLHIITTVPPKSKPHKY